MKTGIPALLLLGLAQATLAATLAVLPGEVIQTKVDAAVPGDIIAIFGGTYPGDVTINKAVRLVEVDGQEVTITGNVTWNNVNNAPPFEGFTVGSSGKGITVRGGTQLILKNVISNSGFGLSSIEESKLTVVGGNYSSINQDGGEMSVSLSNISGSFVATANSQRTVAMRINGGASVRWKSIRAWIGYSSCKDIVFDGNGTKCCAVGIDVNRGFQTTPDLVYLGGASNTFSIVNSKFKHDFNEWAGGSCIYSVAGNHVYLANNYFESVRLYGGNIIPQHARHGTVVTCDGSTSLFMNNIMSGGLKALVMPYGATSRNNRFNGFVTSFITGGVVDSGSTSGDPLFVSGEAPRLQPSSPCVNAGYSDPIFNDLDGTRNDIGPGGGCLFDPQGWTTNKPVVISFDLAPQQLLKGVDTQVTISNGRAVAQP